MVPRVEEPPAVLLTDQVTAGLLVPETVAEKEAELPARTFALEGETATEIAGVAGGGCLGIVEEDVEPQPARVEDRRSAAQRRGEGVRMGSPIFGGVKRRRQLDGGTEVGQVKAVTFCQGERIFAEGFNSEQVWRIEDMP